MYSTRKAVEAVGCSYRQLDYAVRLRGEKLTGSGHRRTWTPHEVIRLALAFHLCAAMPGRPGQSPFPDIASAALDVVEDPPRSGFVMMALPAGTLSWSTDPDAVLEALLSGTVVAARYDLTELLGDFLDDDEIPR